MKKYCLFLTFLMIFALLFTSCGVFLPDKATDDPECVVHQWSDYKYNDKVHWREYTCGCPWPEIVEEHVGYEEDSECDICGLVFTTPTYFESAISLAGEKIKVMYNDYINEDYRAFLQKLDSFAAKFSASAYEKYGEGKNISVSPISVYMALALVCECGDGETRQEILDAVGVTYEEVNKYTKYLYAFCNQEFYTWNEEDERVLSGYELLTNSIWLKDGVQFKNDGVQKLSQEYNCDVFQTQFGTEKAKNDLKAYIEEKTRGLIDGNLPLEEETLFVLLNTFYLNEAWSDIGKDLNFTKEKYTFTNFDGTTVNKNLLMGYYEGGRVQNFDTYSVFYAKTANGFKLHFLVPNGDNTVDDVFTQANIENVLSISSWGMYENMVCHNTRVFFPEFEAEFSESINDIMQENFGIVSLFDMDKCDMTNVIDGRVYCSSIVHKSKLKVDKTGIEGAAITAAIMAGEAVDPFTYEYYDFVVDRAFGFILTDQYGTVLFSGVVNTIE